MKEHVWEGGMRAGACVGEVCVKGRVWERGMCEGACVGERYACRSVCGREVCVQEILCVRFGYCDDSHGD